MDAIPIFPLPNVVLFPGVRVPLHLFEPRYRQMARQALAGASRIGMVAVPPEHAAKMLGDPPVFPVGCEGLIEQSQKLPDGRYNIVLLGTDRFRILEEPPRPDEQLYRTARIERFGDPLSDAERERVAALRGETVDLLRKLLQHVAPERAESITLAQFEGIDDATFVNSLAQTVDFDTPEKQALLEANGVSERSDQLIGLLRFRLAEGSARGSRAPGRLH